MHVTPSDYRRTLAPASLARLALLVALLALPALACNLPGATPAPTDTLPPTDIPVLPATGMAAVSADAAQVRSAPNSEAPLLAQLALGDQVLLTGVSPDGAWYQVQTTDGSQGWVSADFLSQTAAQTQAAEAAAA